MSKNKSGNWFRRHIFLTIIGVVIVIAIIASASGDNNTTPNKKADTKSVTKTAQVAKINQEADDGSFGFTVTAFKCGDTSITQPGDAYYSQTAQGQFCVMSLTVKNIKSSAKSFDDNAQLVFGPNNTQYSPSTEGTVAANTAGNSCMLYPTINPGNSLQCAIAFDVPVGVTPDYAMLHDSSASNGVKVTLQ